LFRLASADGAWEPQTGAGRNGVAAAAGDRLAAFAAAFPAGRAVSICDVPWPDQTLPPPLAERCFARLSPDRPFPPLSCAPDVNLDGRVDDRDVTVRYNGEPLLLSEGDWYVDPNSHSVCLADDFEARWGRSYFELGMSAR
jgi:hypothetical protein